MYMRVYVCVSFKIYFNLHIMSCGDSRCIIRTRLEIRIRREFSRISQRMFREMLVPTRAIRYLRFIRSPISSHLRIFYNHDRSELDRPISPQRDDVGERDSVQSRAPNFAFKENRRQLEAFGLCCC